jgi:hypothetical protein
VIMTFRPKLKIRIRTLLGFVAASPKTSLNKKSKIYNLCEHRHNF